MNFFNPNLVCLASSGQPRMCSEILTQSKQAKNPNQPNKNLPGVWWPRTAILTLAGGGRKIRLWGWRDS